MPRKAVDDVIRAVFDATSAEPKSILEIAKEAGTTWESTKNTLELLEALGVVKSKEEGKRTLYYRPIASGAQDTYFNLPISERNDNLISFMFEEIKKLWKLKTGREPSKTHVYKIIARVNRELDLNLPVGRYLYGEICVKIYDPARTYQYTLPENVGAIRESIERAVNLYSELSVDEVENEHYKETGNQLYKIKKEVMRQLLEMTGKEDIPKLTNKLINLLLLIPKEKKNLIELFTDFIGIVNNLVLFEDDIRVVKQDIVQLFEALWKLMAMNFFYEDLSKMYTKDQLAGLELSIKFQKQEVLDKFSEVYDKVMARRPKRKMSKEAENLKKLQGSVEEARELNEKELHKLAEESVKNSSEIFREFDLD